MSAQEFGEWIEIFQREQLHPAADRMRHAQQIAAARNGPLTRVDKALWSTADCLPPDPWAPPPQPAAPAQPSAAELAAQVARLNALIQP